MVENNKNEVTFIYKRIINTETIEVFNQQLYEMDCSEVNACENPSESYEIFLIKFLYFMMPFFQRKR